MFWAYAVSALAWAFCWVPFGPGFTVPWESLAFRWSVGACAVGHFLLGVFLLVGCFLRRRLRLPSLFACGLSAYALAVLLDWVVRVVARRVT